MVKLYAKDVTRPARVLDLDTGKAVKAVIWVDEEAGLAEAYALDAQGARLPVIALDGSQHWKTHILKGRFRLLFDVQPKSYSKFEAASNCAKCGSVLVLAGQELCPQCRAADLGKPFERLDDSPSNPHKCEQCSRQATWAVSDEVEVAPQKGRVTKFARLPNGTYLFRRRATVKRRYYCASHYQGPRLLDHRGDIIAVEESSHNPDA